MNDNKKFASFEYFKEMRCIRANRNCYDYLTRDSFTALYYMLYYLVKNNNKKLNYKQIRETINTKYNVNFTKHIYENTIHKCMGILLNVVSINGDTIKQGHSIKLVSANHKGLEFGRKIVQEQEE